MNKKNALLLLFTLVLGFSLCLSVSAASPKQASNTESSAAISFIGGDMTFFEAPTLSFGTNQLRARTHSYSAKTVLDQGRLTDARGTLSGWSVRASLTQFEQSGADSPLGKQYCVCL